MIVEAKGGTGALEGDQMSQEWINKKIEVLLKHGDPWGARLAQARDNHQLQGMVVRTRINADDVVEEPEFIIKNFAEISPDRF